MKKHFLYLMVFWLSHSFLSAQNYIDILNLGYSGIAESQYEGFDENFSQEGAWFHLNFPVDLNESGDILMPTAQYNFVVLNNDFYEFDQLRFHNIHFGLGYLKNWKNPHWATYVEGGFSAASTFKSFSSEHLNYAVTLLFNYGKKEELVWKFGADYVGGSFGNWAVPLVGVDWQINSKLYLSFLSFSHLKVEYSISNRVGIGIQSENAAFSFNLTDYFGIRESVVYNYSDEFPYSPQRIGLYTDVYLNENLVFFGKFGYEFAREIFHYDSNEILLEESGYNGKIESGGFLEFGLAWRKF